MAIISKRASGTADIFIDYQRCLGCKLCISVCQGAPLFWDGSKVAIDQTRGFGCFGCGQCMAVCPQSCISIEGRCMSAANISEYSEAGLPSYAQLFRLMQQRRSMRCFSEQAVEQELIELVLSAAATAPVGVPPSEVCVSVLAGRDKVQAFAADLIGEIRRIKWLFSKPLRLIWRAVMGKAAYDSFVSFVPVLFSALDQAERQGEDKLFYNAPLVMVFHAAAFGDPVDAHIAATYATIAAESLGLGSCMIGSVSPLLKQNRKLREKYGIPADNKTGLAVIFGYPAVHYRRALQRSFADISYIL